MESQDKIDRPYRGLTNKELLLRVLDEISIINTKLDAKADRSELQATAASIQAEALSTKEEANQAIGAMRKTVAAKVSRGELFGWLSFAAGVTSAIVGFII